MPRTRSGHSAVRTGPPPIVSGRLDAIVRKNLIGDLVAQVAILTVVIPFVHNRWMVLLWVSRWFPITGIVLSRQSIQRGQINRAVAKLCVGHAVGVLASCFLLPELGPLALLVLVGDLSLLHFVGERLRRQLVAGLLVTAGFGSALCLQSLTGLADGASKSLVVFAIVLHTIGTGITVAQSHRGSYLDLAETNRKLFGRQNRISEAIVEARQQIATSIVEGPVADLHSLHHATLQLNSDLTKDSAHTDTNAIAAQCTEASATAQRALKKLRVLSHGAIPDLLRKHGLSVALVSLFEPFGHDFGSASVELRFEPWVEGALYLCAAEVVRFAAQNNLHIQGSLEQLADNLQLRLQSTDDTEHNDRDGTEHNDGEFAFSPLALDRLGAIGAGWEKNHANDSRLDVIITVSIDTDTDRQTPIEPTVEHALASPSASAERILESFVQSSLVAAVAGFFAMVAGFAIFGLSTLGYIALCMLVVLFLLVVARDRLRKNDFEGCVVAMCLEIFGAGLFVTALEPRAGPITGLITTLPVVLGLPHFSVATLRWITALQIAALSAVMLLSFADWSIVKSSIPLWFLVVVLPPTAAGVAYLVAGAVMTTIDETRRASMAVQETLQRIVVRADTEQQAIERDLHDGAQQQFVAISMQFKMLSKLATTAPERAAKISSTIVDQIRRTREELLAVAEGTSLESLRAGDLQRALTTVVERTPERLRLSFDRNVPSLEPDVARAVYYCCVEAIQNAFKYSGDQSRVTVSVHCEEPSELRFDVVDDGTGFDPAANRGEGQGLVSMRSRMSELGGSLNIRSHPTGGTMVRGSLPLRMSVHS
jgi:signal transduction histidine kinase